MHPAGLTTASTITLALAGVAALVNWWAVTVGRRWAEWVSKPAVMVLLVAVALLMHPSSHRVQAWIVIGLVCSLAGDVFLMLPRERFIEGLAAFLVGHLAYVVALSLDHTTWLGTGVAFVAVAISVAVVGRVVVRSVHAGAHPELTGPVIVYLVVISTMVVAACGTGNPWAIGGAVCFYASDAILSWDKFVRPLEFGRPAIMSTYHLAQFGLTLSLVR